MAAVPTLPLFSDSSKLDGSNFPIWKMKVVSILRSFGHYDFVITPSERPTVGQALSTSSRVATQADVDAWDAHNNRTHPFLILNCQDSVLAHLRAADTAPKVWTVLTTLYEMKTPGRIITMETQLLQLRVEDFPSISAFVAKMKELREELAVCGKQISTEDMAVRLLAKLPPAYDSLFSSIVTSPRATPITWEELLPMVMQVEGRVSSRTLPSGGDTALASTQKGKGKNQGKNKNQTKKKQEKKKEEDSSSSKDVTCSYCKKPGHPESKCYKKKRDEKKKDKESTTDTSTVAVVNKEGIYVSVESHAAYLTSESRSWLLDSGATSHMTNRRDWFSSFKERSGDITIGDSSIIPIRGAGTISIFRTSLDRRYFSDVLYVPDLGFNLLSVSSLTKQGASVEFLADSVIVRDLSTGSTLASGQQDGGLYKFTALISKDADAALWHARFGHLSASTLQQASKDGLVDGLPSISASSSICQACLRGKQTRLPFPQEATHRASKPLELVHSDLCGPMTAESLGGALYMMVIVDDFSRYIWVYFLKSKDQTFSYFKIWKAEVEKQFEHKVKALRSDRGGEFLSNEFDKFLADHGIRRQLTTAHTPSQNGVAERKNRSIIEMGRTMLEHSGLPKKFWAEASATAIHILNRAPTSALPGKTPFEALTGNKPSCAHLRVFGCQAHVHVPKEHRSKLDSKSVPHIFIGYSNVSKAYRLWDPAARKFTISRDVIFDEHSSSTTDASTLPLPLPSTSSASTSTSKPPLTSEGDSSDSSDESGPSSTPAPQQDPPVSQRVPRWLYQTVKDSGFSSLPDSSHLGGLRRSSRHKNVVDSNNFVNFALMSTILDTPPEPSSVEEALSSPPWVAAMQAELSSIERNGTWSLVPRPPKRKVIGVRWVYKTKYHADGSLDKHKARLVVKGYAQRAGVDFDETFAPTARITTIRVVLSLAGHFGWPIFQMDVKSAFLNGDLQEEVYVEQPPGFVLSGKEDMIYRLHKALYGLKQAPRAWYQRIDSFFGKLGLHRSHVDSNLYTLLEGALIVVIIIYVDDLIITGSHTSRIRSVMADLSREFEMTDLGLLHYFLGFEVWQTPQGIFLSQHKYCLEILRRFGMVSSRSVSSPMDPNSKLSISDSSPPCDASLYRQMVGSLIWLTHTRLDIAFSAGVLGSFSAKPLTSHLHAVRRVLRYLNATPHRSILYGRGSTLVGYSDSDWAGDIDNRRSTTGFCFTLGSGAVSWSSKKQPTVALSSTEAEYRAACSAATEAIWLRRLLAELGAPQRSSTLIWCDNQSCIAIAKNPVFHARTKHIEVHYHYIREQILSGHLHLSYCSTKDNAADIFTKPLPQTLLQDHLISLGVAHHQDLRGGVSTTGASSSC